jgi:hypothetical protein
MIWIMEGWSIFISFQCKVDLHRQYMSFKLLNQKRLKINKLGSFKNLKAQEKAQLCKMPLPRP